MKGFWLGGLSLLIVWSVEGAVFQEKLVFIDTTDRESELYQPYIDIIKSVGLPVEYRSLDKLMDGGTNSPLYLQSRALFFIFGNEFLRGLATGSPVSQKIIRILKTIGQEPDKFIGFIFPSFQTPKAVNLIKNFEQLFLPMGIKIPDSISLTPNMSALDAFLYVTNMFLITPIETRPLRYHTMLAPPRDGVLFNTKDIEIASTLAGESLVLLPKYQEFSQIIKQMLPYGLSWFNPINKNHLFISNVTLFSSVGIRESCQVCPADGAVRQEMCRALQQMMWELVRQIHRNPLPLGSCQHQLPVLVRSFGSSCAPKEKGDVCKSGWLEIDVFEPKNKNREKDQKLFIDSIFQSNLDTLWLSFSPNMYYSPIARKKAQEQDLVASISLFTKKLQEGAKSYNKPLPRVMVGFEIVNNLYEPNLPKNCARDLYGNRYPDLPAPLHYDFWHHEVKRPLALLVKQWKKPDVSNGVPLSGVVLDLEMYCRKTSGTFLTTMGFEYSMFKQFIRDQNLSCQPMPSAEMINYFMNKHLSQKYFAFLERKAEGLGREFREFFTQQIPGCSLVCYTPTILVNWFYKGLFKGLSVPQKPLYLFTFNTEFNSYKSWFDKNNINVRHSSVLMLSKLQEKKDFAWASDILKHHDGVWLNRFSRFSEQKANDWAALERPALLESDYGDFFKYLAVTQ